MGILRWWRQPKPLEDPAAPAGPQLATCLRCGEQIAVSWTSDDPPISVSMHRCEKPEARS